MQLDQVRKRRDRVLRMVLDVNVSHLVAEDEEVRRAPVVEAEGHSRVVRVDDRSLPLDPEQVAASSAFDDEPLRGTRDEVRNDGVDSDPPSGDRYTRLPGGHEDGLHASLARSAVELERDAHLADGAVGADG